MKDDALEHLVTVNGSGEVRLQTLRAIGFREWKDERIRIDKWVIESDALTGNRLEAVRALRARSDASALVAPYLMQVSRTDLKVEVRRLAGLPL